MAIEGKPIESIAPRLDGSSTEAIESQSTGMPVLRSWSRVYLVVVVVFIIWVGLLITLKNIFS
jgi:hypothetical protein